MVDCVAFLLCMKWFFFILCLLACALKKVKKDKILTKQKKSCSKSLVRAFCGVCRESFARCQGRQCNFHATVHNNCTINSTTKLGNFMIASRLTFAMAKTSVAAGNKFYETMKMCHWEFHILLSVSLFICRLAWHSVDTFAPRKTFFVFRCVPLAHRIDVRAQKCCLLSVLMPSIAFHHITTAQLRKCVVQIKFLSPDSVEDSKQLMPWFFFERRMAKTKSAEILLKSFQTSTMQTSNTYTRTYVKSPRSFVIPSLWLGPRKRRKTFLMMKRRRKLVL